MAIDWSDLLAALAGLNGDADVLVHAREVLAGAGNGVIDALDNLQTIADRLRQRHVGLELHDDVVELRG